MIPQTSTQQSWSKGAQGGTRFPSYVWKGGLAGLEKTAPTSGDYKHKGQSVQSGCVGLRQGCDHMAGAESFRKLSRPSLGPSHLS